MNRGGRRRRRFAFVQPGAEKGPLRVVPRRRRAGSRAVRSSTRHVRIDDDRHHHPRRQGPCRRAAPGAGAAPRPRTGRGADPRAARPASTARTSCSARALSAAARRAGYAGAGGRRRVVRGRGPLEGGRPRLRAAGWRRLCRVRASPTPATCCRSRRAWIDPGRGAAGNGVHRVRQRVRTRRAQGRRDACWCTAPRPASASPRSRWPRPPARRCSPPRAAS